MMDNKLTVKTLCKLYQQIRGLFLPTTYFIPLPPHPFISYVVFLFFLVPSNVAVAIFCGNRSFCILSTRPFSLNRRGFINSTIHVFCNISLISLFFSNFHAFLFFYGSIYFPYNILFKYSEHLGFFRGLYPDCSLQRLLLQRQIDVGVWDHSRPTIVKVRNEWSYISIK